MTFPKMSRYSFKTEFKDATVEQKPFFAYAILMNLNTQNEEILLKILNQLKKNKAVCDKYFFIFTKMFYDYAVQVNSNFELLDSNVD